MKRKVVIALVLSLSACSDQVDKAAKKRIFSPEDPPQAVAAASEKLPPQDVAEKPAVARRVLGMSAAEATERIGAHRYVATINWEWSAAAGTGGKTVRLKESRALLAGAGGMSGDFFATLSNTNNMGLEVMRVGGKVYARSTYGKDGAGKFRQRLRDRGMAERMRDEAFGAVRDFDQLFRGRLKLVAQGTSSFEGRTAWKYVVSLADAAEETPSALPPLLEPKGGVDDTTRRRRAFYEQRAPKSLQGEIYVDADTSVVLKAHLDGRMGVTGTDGGADAELRLALDSSMSDLGKSPRIEVPKDFLPDEDKPAGIAAALKRFGIERAGADGGVAASGGDLPEDDE
ncbi:MAG: hypothetical protein AMXMBFR34_18240 [Myxococcaceae bacterium]